MSKEPRENPRRSGYGNIYTPHGGSMIIHVQRESGLANRTIVLSQRQVTLLRRGAFALGAVLTIVLLSWFYLAAQAARVPFLTKRLQHLQHDVRRLDTLQAALTELEGRFQQVQRMLGASAVPTIAGTTPPATAPAKKATDSSSTPSTPPNQWPLPITGTIIDHSATDSTPTHGLDIAVPAGTPIRAAGAGIVVEVRDDPQHGRLIRITHSDGYESIYANADEVRVSKGDKVAAGGVIGSSGGALGPLPPHLHFEVRRNGVDVNPASLMKQGLVHGDLQQ